MESQGPLPNHRDENSPSFSSPSRERSPAASTFGSSIDELDIDDDASASKRSVRPIGIQRARRTLAPAPKPRHLVEDPELPPAPIWKRACARLAGVFIIATVLVSPMLLVAGLDALETRASDGALAARRDARPDLFDALGIVVARGASELVRRFESATTDTP
jgi:hypothetical protein